MRDGSHYQEEVAEPSSSNRDVFYSILEPRSTMRRASHGNMTIDEVNEVLDELSTASAEGTDDGSGRKVL